MVVPGFESDKGGSRMDKETEQSARLSQKVYCSVLNTIQSSFTSEPLLGVRTLSVDKACWWTCTGSKVLEDAVSSVLSATNSSGTADERTRKHRQASHKGERVSSVTRSRLAFRSLQWRKSPPQRVSADLIVTLLSRCAEYRARE